MVGKPVDFHKRPVEDTHNARTGKTTTMRQLVNRHGNPVADGEDTVVIQGLVKLAPSVLDFGRNHTKRRPAASEVSVKSTIKLFVVLLTNTTVQYPHNPGVYYRIIKFILLDSNLPALAKTPKCTPLWDDDGVAALFRLRYKFQLSARFYSKNNANKKTAYVMLAAELSVATEKEYSVAQVQDK
ncbi:hypothetical protein B5M09_011962, partial [Aphanomyces astaci]